MRFVITFLVLCITCVACTSSDKEAMDQNELSEDMPHELTFSDDISSMEEKEDEYQKTMQAVESGAMDSTSFTYDCYGETTGKVTYYRKDGTIRMIENSYNELSHRDATERFFVSNGTPYFVYRKTTDWSFIAPQETRDNITEEQFYVQDDTLAQCTQKEYVLESNAADNPDPNEIVREASECPPVQNVMDQYEVLLSHEGETRAIGCLEED